MTPFPKPKCEKCRRVARSGHVCKPRKAIPRTALGTRTAAPLRGKKPPRTNPKRQKVNRLRVYHSTERIGFVASLPCIVLQCWDGPCHGHHTAVDGMGRKGPYQSVVPLCPTHHDAWHRMGRESFLAAHPLRHGWTPEDHAAEVQRLFLAFESDSWGDRLGVANA